MPVRNDADIERLLLSRVRTDPRPYQQRANFAGVAVSALLERVGDPHHQLQCVHITGSKGKGSVALMCEHLLQHAGLRTGTFTSPHLQRWNERIRVDGHDIDTASFASALDTFRPHLTDLDEVSDEYSPTFFDLLTATALLVFARNSCDAVIVETGLGGSFDATNVITPLACAITSIELEHTDKLGTTLQAIARHKAGIIKPGIPVITAHFAKAAQQVISQRAREQSAPEWRLGREWSVTSEQVTASSQCVDYQSADNVTVGQQSASFTLPHAAPHMATNAGLALTLIAAAKWRVQASALSDCVLPARAQVIRRQPWIVIDGAHTEASLRALALNLRQWPAKHYHFVISATPGKSMDALAELIYDADYVTITRADPQRSAPGHDVAKHLNERIVGLQASVFEQPSDAFRHAEAKLDKDSLLCVCGSVYLAGAALRHWQVDNEK